MSESISTAGAVPVLLLTTAEAAKALSISVKTLSRLTKKKSIPHFREGHVIRYRLADLMAWLDQRIAKGA